MEPSRSTEHSGRHRCGVNPCPSTRATLRDRAMARLPPGSFTREKPLLAGLSRNRGGRAATFWLG
jgi:hypothetical protein